MGFRERQFAASGYDDTSGKTENFLTRNVKLITFLCVIAIFLGLFGPLSIFRIRDYIQEKRALEGRITLEVVVAFSDLNRDVYLSELLEYTGERRDNDLFMLYYMDVDDDFLLLATAEKPAGKVRHLTLTHLSTGESVDVLKGDVRSFLEKIKT